MEPNRYDVTSKRFQGKTLNARRFLRTLYDTAVAAAQPSRCVSRQLPDIPPGGRLIVIACGKAGSEMARAAEQHYRDIGQLPLLTGVCVTRHGYGQPLAQLQLIEAGHPVPDEGSLKGAQAAIDCASAATSRDMVLFLISGGASSLCVAPAGQITLAEKQSLTRALLKSGAPIHEMNCVRKHISRFKGGRLASYARQSPLITLAISDTPGDLPETIGSGPTCPDSTTLEEARAIVAKYRIELSPSIAAALADPANETPKAGDPIFARARYELVATGRDSIEAAAELARGFGYEVIVLGDSIEGEARDVAYSHAQLAKTCRAEGRRALILSGGELTVTVNGNGRGGPNQEYALALAIALNGETGIAALAGDTDGSDGGTGAADDPAGAVVDPGTITRAAALNLAPATFLENNDSTGFFRQTGDLLICGPTGTNVNDFRAILVDNSIGI